MAHLLNILYVKQSVLNSPRARTHFQVGNLEFQINVEISNPWVNRIQWRSTQKDNKYPTVCMIYDTFQLLLKWTKARTHIHIFHIHIFTETCLNHNILDQAIALDRWNCVLSWQSARLQQDSVFTSLQLGVQMQSNLTGNDLDHIIITISTVYIHPDSNVKKCIELFSGCRCVKY